MRTPAEACLQNFPRGPFAVKCPFRRKELQFLHKICVVIGASGGIGQELVAELRRRGARVLPIVHSTSPSTKGKSLTVDLRDPAAIFWRPYQMSRSKSRKLTAL